MLLPKPEPRGTPVEVLNRQFTETTEQIELAKAEIKAPPRGLAWPWADLRGTLGLMRPGYLIVVSGRPSGGKTTFLLNLLDGLVGRQGEQLRVWYVGTEVEPHVLYRKWAALRLGMEEDAVLSGSWALLPTGAQDTLLREMDVLQGKSGVWFPVAERPQLSTLDRLFTERQLATGKGPHVVVLDHLHQLAPARGQAPHEAIAETVRAFKSLAVEQNVVVIMASQLHRDSDGVFDGHRPPYLGSFLGSSAIEHTMDVGLGLYRPLLKMTAKDDRAVRTGERPISDFVRRNCMAVKVLKHRYRGTVNGQVMLLGCNRGQVSGWSYEHQDGRMP